MCSIWVFADITELMKNQTIAVVEVVMSDLVVIGDYELLEKQREAYRNN